jgi:hypothetical protein
VKVSFCSIRWIGTFFLRFWAQQKSLPLPQPLRGKYWLAFEAWGPCLAVLSLPVLPVTFEQVS